MVIQLRQQKCERSIEVMLICTDRDMEYIDIPKNTLHITNMGFEGLADRKRVP